MVSVFSIHKNWVYKLGNTCFTCVLVWCGMYNSDPACLRSGKGNRMMPKHANSHLTITTPQRNKRMKRRLFLKLTGETALGAALLTHLNTAAASPSADVPRLTYTLQDGWVDNWLLAGPQLINIPDASYKYTPQLAKATFQQFHQEAAQGTQLLISRAEQKPCIHRPIYFRSFRHRRRLLHTLCRSRCR